MRYETEGLRWCSCGHRGWRKSAGGDCAWFMVHGSWCMKYGSAFLIWYVSLASCAVVMLTHSPA